MFARSNTAEGFVSIKLKCGHGEVALGFVLNLLRYKKSFGEEKFECLICRSETTSTRDDLIFVPIRGINPGGP